MKYFINICLPMLERDDETKNKFWKKDIRISEKFFHELIREKEVMLIPELVDKNELIPNFSHYFDKTIEFSVIKTEIVAEKGTLICKLHAYFKYESHQDDAPF